MRDSRSPAASTTVSAGAIRPISVSTRSRVRSWEGVKGATGRRFYASAAGVADAPHTVPSMSPDQLEQERRFGRLAAAAAVVSAVSLYAGVLWAQLSYADAPDNKPARLRYFDSHAGEIVGSAAVQALGWLLLTVVAVHLYRAIRARRADEPLVVLILGVYGPVALAAVTLARAVALTTIAGDFAASPSQTLD